MALALFFSRSVVTEYSPPTIKKKSVEGFEGWYHNHTRTTPSTSPSPFQDRGGREGEVVTATSRYTITQRIQRNNIYSGGVPINNVKAGQSRGVSGIGCDIVSGGASAPQEKLVG